MEMDPKKWYMEHADSYSLSDYYRNEEDELWSEMAPGFAEKCNHVAGKEGDGQEDKRDE